MRNFFGAICWRFFPGFMQAREEQIDRDYAVARLRWKRMLGVA